MSDETHDTAALFESPEADSPFEDDANASGEEGAYRLELPNFQGPLDLLLHLIRKHEIDIYDIPIVLITQQYNQYLEAMEELDLEVAAEYVYMAALLIHIKSKMLLPRPEPEGDVEDPRQELVARLLEYQRFRSVAESFAEVDLVRMGVWPRPKTALPETEEAELDLSEVSLFDLIDAFQLALRRYKLAHPQAIELRPLVHRVSDKMRDLLALLAEKSPLRLLWVLEGRDRAELVALFLAVLELVRLGALSLQQSESFGDVLLHRTHREIDAAELAVYDQ